MRIIANVRALAAYGLNIDDLRTTIANANVNSPKGSLDGPARSWTLNANDQIQDPKEYEQVIVAYKNGNPVRLADVAQVTQGAENTYLAGWVNNTPGIILNIQRQPGANVIQVVDRIKKLLPDLSASLPAAAEVTILTDRTVTIRASVHDVEFELTLAVVLVVVVIFLFLRSIPATFIPSISVPLSLVGTLAAMYLLGYSLNNLSLMALVIATGFVVDDAIVMIENISRYIEEGMAPLEAALKGSGEIGFTIVSLTVSLIAVLIPLLFMGDVVGRLFHEFAITLSVTIVISAVVSLTAVPMLCAKLLRHQRPEEEGRIARWSNEKFQALIDQYGRALTWVLERQRMTLYVAIATLGVTVLLYVFIPKGFFPVQDTGVIQAITEAPQSVSFTEMSRRQASLAEVILKDPDVVSLSSFIGVDGSNITLNSGRMLINLKPRDERGHTASEIIRRLQQETADVTGISLYMQPVQDLSIDTAVSRTQYQFVLEDANPVEFNTWVPKLVEELQKLPQLEDVASDQENEGLVAYLTIDRDTAARFGITPATVDNALYDAFGQRIVSTIFTQSNQYRVILQADKSLMDSLDALGTIYLPSATAVGGQVPLSALVKVTQQTAPLSVDHLGQFPSTTISFNLASGASLGAAVDAIKKTEASIGMPPSVMTTFQGAALAFQATLGNELMLIIAAIVTVYIVLGVLYESFIHPITILSTLPSAGVGALLALIIARARPRRHRHHRHHPADRHRQEERDHDDRLRAGRRARAEDESAGRHLPRLALALSPDPHDHHGGALERAAADAGTGRGLGAASSARHHDRRRPDPLQLLTLFTTPVIYLYFDRLERRVRARFEPQPSGEPAR